MTAFSLWSQAIDDNSPDHFYSQGRQITPTETAERENIALTVSNVIKVGSNVYKENGVSLTIDDKMFVLEIPLIERDARGRVAPIVCCGLLAQIDTQNKNQDPVAQVISFAENIGGAVSNESSQHGYNALEELKKKKLFKWLAVVPLLLAGLAIFLALFHRS